MARYRIAPPVRGHVGPLSSFALRQFQKPPRSRLDLGRPSAEISTAASAFASSGKLHSRVNKTGTPAAAASKMAMLKPSLKDGSAKTSAAARICPYLAHKAGLKKPRFDPKSNCRQTLSVPFRRPARRRPQSAIASPKSPAMFRHARNKFGNPFLGWRRDRNKTCRRPLMAGNFSITAPFPPAPLPAGQRRWE